MESSSSRGGASPDQNPTPPSTDTESRPAKRQRLCTTKGIRGERERWLMMDLPLNLVWDIFESLTIVEMFSLLTVSRQVHRVLAPSLFSVQPNRHHHTMRDPITMLDWKEGVKFCRLRNLGPLDFGEYIQALQDKRHKLKRLDLKYCQGYYTDLQMLVQTHRKSLECLALPTAVQKNFVREKRKRDTGLLHQKIFQGCSNLKQFILPRDSGLLRPGDISITLGIAHSCKNLLHLDISGDFTEQSLESIGSNLTQLRYLRLEADRVRVPLTDYGFPFVVNLKDLRVLRLIFGSGCYISEATAIPTLQKLVKLEKLELPYLTELTDDVIAAIADACPLLRLVDLYSCRLLTNKGVKDLVMNLPHLRCVNVKRCHRLKKPHIFEILSHGSLQHVQIPNFSGLMSADTMVQLTRAGFTHQGAGRIFRSHAPVLITSGGGSGGGGLAPHPTSGLYLRCPTCKGLGSL